MVTGTTKPMKRGEERENSMNVIRVREPRRRGTATEQGRAFGRQMFEKVSSQRQKEFVRGIEGLVLTWIWNRAQMERRDRKKRATRWRKTCRKWKYWKRRLRWRRKRDNKMKKETGKKEVPDAKLKKWMKQKRRRGSGKMLGE